MKNTIRSFDVDFAPCDCEGTKNIATRMQVIAVRWKRTDKNPNGKMRFQCMRCKTSWSMNNVPGGTKPSFNASHPEEVKRRAAISPDYNQRIAVNLGIRTNTSAHFRGVLSGRASCRKPGAE